ncbi:MAG: beta-propeller fold lactonase family protein [Verrucomicrobiales bacterium]
MGTGGSGAKGIYRLEFNAEDGSFSKAELAAEVGSPGFLALHPNGRVLYAACQIERTPSVAAYVIAADASSLSLLNAQPIGDGGATHVSVDATGKMLLTAQYGGGSTAGFPLNEDGSVGERSQLIEHEGGSKVVGNRQDSPHPHWTGFDPANRFAFVPDLGLDRVLIYRADPPTPSWSRTAKASCRPAPDPATSSSTRMASSPMSSTN